MAAWTTQVFNFLVQGQYSTAPPAISPGSTGPLLMDNQGRLVVVVNAPGSAPSTGLSGGTTSWYDTVALAATGTVKGSAGTLFQLFATNNGTSTFFLQVHDTVGAPTAGAIPRFSFPLTPGQVMSVDLARGRAFANGINWVNSTTSATYTATASNTFWVNAEYI